MESKDIAKILKAAVLELQKTIADRISEISFPVKNVKELEVEIHKEADSILLKALKENEISCIVLNDKSTMQGPVCEKIIIGKDPEYLITIDSIDGSINLVKGVKNYSSAISVAKYGNNVTFEDLEYSLVFNLVTGDLIEGFKAKGSYLNGVKIKTSQNTTLNGAMVSVDLNYRGPRAKYFVEIMDKLILKLIEKRARIRMIGTNSLETSMIGYGGVDVFIDLRDSLQAPDIAPSYLIVKEAGGIVVDKFGNDLSNMNLLSKEKISVIYAANLSILTELLEILELQKKNN